MKKIFLVLTISVGAWWLLKSTPEKIQDAGPAVTSEKTETPTLATQQVDGVPTPTSPPPSPPPQELTNAEKLAQAERELNDSGVMEQLREGRLSLEQQAEVARRIQYIDDLRAAEIERRLKKLNAQLDGEKQ